jgi:adenosine deaminase
MRLFIPSLTHSGHDQFFNSFGKFSPVLDPVNRSGQALAEVLNQAATDSVVRLETKFSPEVSDFPTLTAALEGSASGAVRDPARFPEALAVLRSVGLDAKANTAISTTTDMLAYKDSALKCGSAKQQPGCGVDLGLIAQVNRNAAPASVFAQLALDFTMASRDSRVVAVDLVAPEDGLNALADYSLHMQMVRFMRTQFPGVHVTLHAGELVPGLAPPAALTSHIRQAVEIAGAERIGHGVDIRSESNAKQLMNEMRKRGVMVEISLTSNEQILGIKGMQSQLPVYRANGVPVSLSTDDPGVERTDLSTQYMKARRWFHLSYAELKKMSYDGIAHAFVSEARKQALKTRLDRSFATFEAKYAR